MYRLLQKVNWTFVYNINIYIVLFFWAIIYVNFIIYANIKFAVILRCFVS